METKKRTQATDIAEIATKLDGNDIGLLCQVESRHDQYYKFCKVIKEGKNDINRGTTGNIER